MLPSCADAIQKLKAMALESKKIRIDWEALKPSNLHKLFDDEIVFKLLSPFIGSFHTLNMMACTSKHMHCRISEDADARKHWIQMAAEVTAMPERGFVPEQITKTLEEITDKAQFFDRLRALICPWTSIPVACANGGDFFASLAFSRYMFVSKDSTRLIFQSRSEHNSFQLSGATEWSEQWERDVITQNVTVQKEREYLEDNHHHFSREIQALLDTPLDMYKFTSTDASHATFSFHHVHGGVFAVMAHFNVSPRVLVDGENGIYFFSYRDCRMLAHISMHQSRRHDQCSMQSLPGKLWILTEEWLMHHMCPPFLETEDQAGVWLSKRESKMDPALYLASQGDTEALLYCLEHDMCKLDINTQAEFNKRTVLHYAAKTGQTETVLKLMENRGSAYVPDFNHETALQLAVRGLHHETVEAIVQNEPMSSSVFHGSFRELRQFRELMHHIKMDVESVRYQCRISIPSIVKSLLLHMPDNPGMLEHILVHALESKTILASAEATEFIFNMGGAALRERYMNQGIFRRLFGGFDSIEHEQEAVKTMIMTVEDFGVDINYRWGITRDTHLIWAVRYGSLLAVKTLIEDLHADIHGLSNIGEGIRSIAYDRTQHSRWCRDTAGESDRILVYIKKLFAAARLDSV
jgi:hypothetical protein